MPFCVFLKYLNEEKTQQEMMKVVAWIAVTKACKKPCSDETDERETDKTKKKEICIYVPRL